MMKIKKTMMKVMKSRKRMNLNQM